MNPTTTATNKLIESAELLRFAELENAEPIAEASLRTLAFDYYDSLGICIHVWHSGLGKQPWMFEIRKNGLLYGGFEGVSAGFDSRADAEAQAFEVADSMEDGTFELRFTS